jgi:putative transposase
VILDLVAQAEADGARLEAACEVIGLCARTVRRWRDTSILDDGRAGPLTAAAHALTPAERAQIVAVATSAEYRNLSPKQIVPRLADTGLYLASESSFYRVLRAEKLLAHREPSRPRTHKKPNEYVATGPGQVWTWDIAYLRACVRGTFYYLCLALDIFSRKIVAANVHAEESALLAGSMVKAACLSEQIDPTKLTLHSDNGGPMKGSTMLATCSNLAWLPLLAALR